MAHRDKTRKRIQKKERVNILKRDKYICGYCGKKKKASNLAIDHIIPVRYGGFHGSENWVSACKSCNRKKWHYGPNEIGSPILKRHSGCKVAKCSWMAKDGRFPVRIPRISYKRKGF